MQKICDTFKTDIRFVDRHQQAKFKHKVSKFLSQFEHNWVLYCPHSKEKGQHPERKDLYVR